MTVRTYCKVKTVFSHTFAHPKYPLAEIHPWVSAPSRGGRMYNRSLGAPVTCWEEGVLTSYVVNEPELIMLFSILCIILATSSLCPTTPSIKPSLKGDIREE